MIGSYDVLIAGQARVARDMILVTNNTSDIRDQGVSNPGACAKSKDWARVMTPGYTPQMVLRGAPPAWTLDFIAELFAQFRPVTVRRLFGGAGIYAEGLMFALVFDGAVYLKVDAASIPDFEREGCKPFVYTRAKSPGRVGRHSLSYWRHARAALRRSGRVAGWAGRALAIAQFSKTAPRAPAKTRAARKRVRAGAKRKAPATSAMSARVAEPLRKAGPASLAIRIFCKSLSVRYEGDSLGRAPPSACSFAPFD